MPRRGTRRRRRTARTTRKPSYLLQTRSRRGKRNLSPVWYRLGAVALLLVVLAFSVYACVQGLRVLRDLVFARNERFTIKRIEIEDGQIKTEEMIREYLAYEGVTVGTNLFSFDIDEFQRLYLERNPLVRSMEIKRRLPDTLYVRIIEREPLARLGQRATLVADREGFVFRLSSGLHKLPVIIGCKDPQLEPGGYVRGLARSAVDVLAMCDNPRLGLLVLGVDIRKREYLVLHIVTPHGIKEANLWWDGMGDEISEESRKELAQSLMRLRQASRADGGRHRRLDATFPGKVFAQ